jgi:predicted ArsR family transcriptional regulator
MNSTQEAILQFLKQRRNPVSVYDLAAKFNMSTDGIRMSMRRLAKANLVRPEKLYIHRPGFKRAAWKLHYSAVKPKTEETGQYDFHNPFGL